MPRRKTYHYLLLLFIVFSGLAGTPTDDVLSKKERKFAADHLKNTKTDLQNAIKGLSASQLDYKPSADKWSVKECVYHIAISEKNLWAMLEKSMKEPTSPEKKKDLKVTDEQVVKMIESRENKVKTFGPLEPQNTGYKTLEEAIEENWSLSQIKERIKALRPAKSEPTQNPLKNRMKEVSRQLLGAKFWDNPKKQKALEKLLSQMEALLADEQ